MVSRLRRALAWISGGLALLLLAAPAHGQDQSPAPPAAAPDLPEPPPRAPYHAAQLRDGRYVLAATWPQGAERVCFGEDISTAPLGCAGAPVAMPDPFLVVEGETLHYRTAGGLVGYVLTPLTGGGVRLIRAYAEAGELRSENSLDVLRIVLAPDRPRLLEQLAEQLGAAQQTVEALRELEREGPR